MLNWWRCCLYSNGAGGVKENLPPARRSPKPDLYLGS